MTVLAKVMSKMVVTGVKMTEMREVLQKFQEVHFVRIPNQMAWISPREARPKLFQIRFCFCSLRLDTWNQDGFQLLS